MEKESDITLRQGLINFHEKYEDYLSHDGTGVSNEAQDFFMSHDIAHVLFGCDITLYGEGAVKIWTIFGTTLGFWNHIRGYKEANAFELAQNFSFVDMVNNIFRLLYAIPQLIIRAKRMRKPWPWSGFEPYLDKPLSEIRREFNIQTL